MKIHEVKVHPSAAVLPRERQLAWKIAAVAANTVAVRELDFHDSFFGADYSPPGDNLAAQDPAGLNLKADRLRLRYSRRDKRGIF